MNQNSRFSYKLSETAYERGCITSHVVEMMDTPEFRHYIYTVGSPALIRGMDELQEARHAQQQEGAESDQIMELLNAEKRIDSNKLFDYLLVCNEEKELQAEIDRLENENRALSHKIDQLKEIVSKETFLESDL